MFWFYLSIPVGCILMGIFLIRDLIGTLKALNQERTSQAKSEEANSIWSIGFIVVSLSRFNCLHYLILFRRCRRRLFRSALVLCIYRGDRDAGCF